VIEFHGVQGRRRGMGGRGVAKVRAPPVAFASVA
jgi:hypothetical protein